MLDVRDRKAITAAVSRACEVLRGATARGEVGELLLAMLMLKYFSDISSERPNRQVLVLTASDFHALHAARRQPGNGARIEHALAVLEATQTEFGGMFRNIRFEAAELGNEQQRDRLLGELLEIFEADKGFDFRGQPDYADQAVAYACEAFIQRSAEMADKLNGGFFTPFEVCELMARLLQPQPGERVGDPACGSGSLLIACSRQARKARTDTQGCALYGQEQNGRVWALARMNMVLHKETDYRIEWGDTLRDPRLLDAGGRLERFDVVVSSPPLSLRDWGHEEAESDRHQRYRRGVPPRAAADYAFLSHMVATLGPQGRMAVLVPHGVLFRGAAEGQIREQLVRENLVDAVIALPAKLLPHTAIPVAILLLRKAKPDDTVLFIDASTEFQRGKVQNVLRQSDLDRIEHAYHAMQGDGRFSQRVPLQAVAANDYNLSVARYLQPIERETQIDLGALRQEREVLIAELASLEMKLAALRSEVENG